MGCKNTLKKNVSIIHLSSDFSTLYAGTGAIHKFLGFFRACLYGVGYICVQTGNKNLLLIRN